MVAPRRGVRYGGIIVTPGRIPGLLHVAPNGAVAARGVRPYGAGVLAFIDAREAATPRRGPTRGVSVGGGG
jgi:hypothetical protein